MPDLAFLLDANMPRSAGQVLEKEGFPVEDVRDIGLGSATDEAIVDHALEEDLVVVTRDTDFGFSLRYPDHPGALLVRLPSTATADDIARRLRTFLEAVDEDELKDAIVVLERNRYRRRPIDDAPEG